MGRDVTRTSDIHRLIVEGLSAAVLVFNQELELQYINPAGEMLYQASAKRLTGMHIGELLPQEKGLINKVLNSLSSSQPFTEREINLDTPAQKTVIVNCVVTPVSDTPGEPILLIELNQMDRSLRISREKNQLSQNNAMRALVRGMAHEIKNPLGGLRGAAQLLERELATPALKEYTNIIIGEADRLRNLVNRMLGPNTLPQRQLINIHEIVEHVRQLIDAEAANEVVIQTDYDPSIPELYADRDQLIQAVLNIMGNAAQAVARKGRIMIRTRAVRQFTIGSERYKLVCQLDIIDDGPGIPAEMLESIFYPMVTTRPEGSGLGLSIAQSLVQQNGGLIKCQSEPGNTMFRILLPISEGRPDDDNGVTTH